MLVGVGRKARCGGRKEKKKVEERGIERLREISLVFVFTRDSGL